MISQAVQAVDAGAAPSCQPSPGGFPELKAGSLGGFIPVEITPAANLSLQHSEQN